METTTTKAIEQEIAHKEAEVQALKQALQILQGGHVVLAVSERTTNPQSEEYRDLGIVQATTKFLREVGEPRTTSEIKDALMSRGWTTQSKNATATIYATLQNSKAFKRTSDGNWSLKGERDSRTS